MHQVEAFDDDFIASLLSKAAVILGEEMPMGPLNMLTGRESQTDLMGVLLLFCCP